MKTRIYTISLLTLALLVSCQNREEAPAIDKTFKLIAVQDNGAESKTVISGERSVYWEPTEEIKVFRADGTGYLFKSANTEPAASAVFSGELTVDDVEAGEELWAVYPFSDGATFDGEAITTVLPSDQVARPESFARNMNLSVARTTGNKLQFFNVGGGVRFSVTQEGVSKVIFEGLNGEILSGKVTIGFEEGVPVVKEVSGGSMFIMLTPPEGETFQTGKWYYMVAIPGALEQGYKLRFYKGEAYAKKVSETPVTIKRGVFGSVADADKKGEYESVTAKYPETKEEWEESVEMTEQIVDTWDKIIDDLDAFSDINALVNTVENIENVQSARMDGSTLEITQKDGFRMKVLLETYGYSPEEENNTEETTSFSGVVNTQLGLRQNIIPFRESNSEKKALILLPFYSAWFKTEPLDSYKSDLMAAGFKETNIRVLKNGEAGYQAFYGSNLSKYDVVIIHTHGGFDSSGVTNLITGTKYNSEYADKYLKNAPDSYALVIKDVENFGYGNTKSTSYVAFTASFLSDADFPGSWIHLSACNSMTCLDLADAFIKAHASFVTGYTRSVFGLWEGEPTTKQLLSYLSYGYSSIDAYSLTDKSYLNAHGKKDYYLSDPHPYNLESDVDGYYVTLSWEKRPNKGHYEFDVFVNGEKIKTTDETSTRIYCDINGESNWWVVAKMYINGSLMRSFTSEEKSFNIGSPGEAKVEFSRKALNFEDTKVGQTAEMDWTITNVGEATLKVTSITVPEGFSTDFSSWSSKSLEPTESHTFKVTFKPTEAKQYSGKMVFKSNAVNAQNQGFTIGGKGISSEGKPLKSMALSTNYPGAYFSDVSLDFKYDSKGRLSSVGNGMYTFSYSGNTMTFSDNGTAQLNSSGQFSSITWYRTTVTFKYDSEGRLSSLNDSGMKINYKWSGNDLYSVTYSDGSTEMKPHFEPSSYPAPEKGVDINLMMRIFLNEIGLEGVLPDGNCFPMMASLIGKRSEHVLGLQVSDTETIDRRGFDAFSQYKGSDGKWHTLDPNTLYTNWTEGTGEFEVKGSNVPYKLESKSWNWTADSSGAVTKGVWPLVQYVASSVTGTMVVRRSSEDINYDGVVDGRDITVSFKNGQVNGSSSKKNYSITFTFGY